MVVFVETVVALVLSAVLLEVYRVLRRRKALSGKALSQDAVGLDLFLVIGSLVAVALWMRVLSQTMVG